MADVEFLKTVPLFSGLSREDLQRLARLMREVRLSAGTELFSEGSPGDFAYVIREGKIEIRKRSAGTQVLLAVRSEGELIGEMALLQDAPRMASAWAAADSLVLGIGKDQLNELFATNPSAARAMLLTVAARLRETEARLRQSEKMAQLGTLTAGVAHELNNPASAVLRGAEQLSVSLGNLGQAWARLRTTGTGSRDADRLEGLLERAITPPRANVLGVLDRGDREEAVEAWLEAHDADEALPYRAELVDMGLDIDDLEAMRRNFPDGGLGPAVHCLALYHSVASLLAEISHGAEQIASIVQALKSYSYLGQAPVQAVDIHESLENTLLILRSKLKQGIVIRREYDPELPRIHAYGSELNQVWTNLIDNAVDALDGKGEIRIRTARSGVWVLVEFRDGGQGIPEECQERLFTPFFTTKAVGSGTGLGLNISQNIVHKHSGQIRFRSRPGATVFQVVLPVDFSRVDAGTDSVPAFAWPEDA